ncbi:MAG: hypothetical protein V4801_28070 [Burkholderia gladioli]
MLLNVQRSAFRLRGTSDPVIEALINLLPDYSSGRRLHALLVNRMQGALPGNFSRMFGTGPSFLSIFYPKYQADALLPLLSETGLDNGWWSNFSVAVLCQSIQDMGSDIRGQMLGDKINTDVANFNTTLRGRCARPYARVLAATFPPLVSLLNRVDRATARQQFHDALLANVINRQLWYQAGMWTSPDWEMFNQYAKYIALGADDAQVDALIDALSGAGLPIPQPVDRNHWRGYGEALRDKPSVDREDVRADTAAPIQTTTYPPTVGRGMPVGLPNGNCYEFTANTQPGNPYRSPPSSCCFTGDTEVLSAAGTAVALRRIRPGDVVQTRDGVATVAFVARPKRGGRALYQLNGSGPIFTDTHPFLNASASAPTEPAILALDPTRLAWAVPTLSEDGIGSLAAGRMLMGRQSGTDDALAAEVKTVALVAPKPEDSDLYDLNLVMTTTSRQEFWAGSAGQFYLVAPEFPVLAQAGTAAVAAVAALEGLIAAGGPGLARWPAAMPELIHRYGAAIFNTALETALQDVPSFGAELPQQPLLARIDALYHGLGSVSVDGANAIATMFDGFLSNIVAWLTSSIAMGWREPANHDGEIVVVTIFDIALAPGSPMQAAEHIRMEVRVNGSGTSASTSMWNRGGRQNTRFHHYFDQLVHLKRTDLGSEAKLEFAVMFDGATLPALSGSAPLVIGDALRRFQSAQLFDAAGSVVGTIRFDTRRLTRQTAEAELGRSGLWTETAAQAYANAIGARMVAPVIEALEVLIVDERA